MAKASARPYSLCITSLSKRDGDTPLSSLRRYVKSPRLHQHAMPTRACQHAIPNARTLMSASRAKESMKHQTDTGGQVRRGSIKVSARRFQAYALRACQRARACACACSCGCVRARVRAL
eukprot:1178490-Pleurochrysis_carterae.AAC.2